MEAKLAPNLPQWMVDHANRYLSSGGSEGHMYKMTQPGPANDGAVAAADDDGPEVGGEVHLPAVLWGDGQELFRRRLQRRGAGASGVVPEHPRQSGGRGAGGDPEGEGAGTDGGWGGAGAGCGRGRWSSGRPMRITRRRPSGRSRWWCWIRFSKPSPSEAWGGVGVIRRRRGRQPLRPLTGEI